MQVIALDSFLDFAKDLAGQAGRAIKSVRQKGVSSATKLGFEVVTNADLASHELIATQIFKAFPNHGLMSEEGGGEGEVDAEYQWVVDPLDGTANFLHGHDHVAVSIALNIHGKTSVGVVHAPFSNETFWAIRGGGAFRNGSRIGVSGCTEVSRALFATGFPHDRKGLERLVERLVPILRTGCDIRRLAAPSLDICWVADGRLDGFLDRLQPWDFAAATLIACEAGAAFSEEPIGECGQSDVLVATPALHDEFLSLSGLFR